MYFWKNLLPLLIALLRASKCSILADHGTQHHDVSIQGYHRREMIQGNRDVVKEKVKRLTSNVVRKTTIKSPKISTKGSKKKSSKSPDGKGKGKGSSKGSGTVTSAMVTSTSGSTAIFITSICALTVLISIVAVSNLS
jgi:hypothetical protein